jgi:RNA polymerase sigma-70 factor, ECF subfamily
VLSNTLKPVPEEVANLTELLNRMRHDRAAADQALALVYRELHVIALRRMRWERVDHTLQPTALINEAFMKLVNAGSLEFQSRGHFFALASGKMRQILVDYARRTRARIRAQEEFDNAPTVGRERDIETILAIDDALNELATIRPRAAKIAELKYYGGCTDLEVGEALEVSIPTVQRDFKDARSWLFSRLQPIDRSSFYKETVR